MAAKLCRNVAVYCAVMLVSARAQQFNLGRNGQQIHGIAIANTDIFDQRRCQGSLRLVSPTNAERATLNHQTNSYGSVLPSSAGQLVAFAVDGDCCWKTFALPNFRGVSRTVTSGESGIISQGVRSVMKVTCPASGAEQRGLGTILTALQNPFQRR